MGPEVGTADAFDYAIAEMTTCAMQHVRLVLNYPESPLLPQAKKLREPLGLAQAMRVGDRGMISQKPVGALREHEGFSWITALQSSWIRSRVEGDVRLSGLFDERRILEFTREDPPST